MAINYNPVQSKQSFQKSNQVSSFYSLGFNNFFYFIFSDILIQMFSFTLSINYSQTSVIVIDVFNVYLFPSASILLLFKRFIHTPEISFNWQTKIQSSILIQLYYSHLLRTIQSPSICSFIIFRIVSNDQSKLSMFLSMWPKRSFNAKLRNLFYYLQNLLSYYLYFYYCLAINPVFQFDQIIHNISITIKLLQQHLLQQFGKMFKKRNVKNNGIDLDQIKNEGEEQIGKPKKKVKLQKLEVSNFIGGSTANRKTQTDAEVHKHFQSLAYKRGGQKQQQQILVGQEAIDHETQQAKKKYLQNVQITKQIKDGKLSTKIYRGANAYANYKLSQAELQNPMEHYKWKHGPTRASSNGGAKNTMRIDYDPSLCKDWHDSGYCVFGNSCIYLHDRSNYKTGWELDKDYEKAERERWKRIANPDLNEEPDYIKDLQKYKPQQICKHCNENLKQAVQVSCQHIFCRKCASQMINGNSKCSECKKRLNGIMNNAEKALSKQKQQYEEMLKSAQKNNENVKAKRTRFKDTNSLDVFTAQ